MNRKILLVLSFFLVSVVSAFADDIPQFLVAVVKGEDKPFKMSAVDKILFNREKQLIIIRMLDGSDVTMPRDDVSLIKFTVSDTSVESLPNDEEGLKVENGSLVVNGEKGTLRIYGTDGAMKYAYNVESDVVIDFTALPSGIYIISINQKTIKFRK